MKREDFIALGIDEELAGKCEKAIMCLMSDLRSL